MSQTSYNIKELKEDLKQLILDQKSLYPDLITLINNDTDYFTLFMACFKPDSNSYTSFFNELFHSLYYPPGYTVLYRDFQNRAYQSTFQHAHFGYLLYLASIHKLSIKLLPNEFDDEALGNWCDECYQALKEKISFREKAYLAKIIPKKNSSMKELATEQSDIYFKGYERLPLCFSSKNKQFLQHLHELCEAYRKKSTHDQADVFFSSMITFYMQAQKVEVKEACRSLIQEFYFFEKEKKNFSHQNLVNAWDVMSKAYEKGKSLDRENNIHLVIAVSIFIIASIAIFLILGMMKVFPLTAAALLIISIGIWAISRNLWADIELSIEGYRSNHTALTKAIPQLTFFHKNISASNDLVVLHEVPPTTTIMNDQ